MKKALTRVLVFVLCLAMLSTGALALELPELDVLETTVTAVEEATTVENTVESGEEAETLNSGNESAGFLDVTSYEELVAALADTNIGTINIHPVSWVTNEPFSWPVGEVTLELTAANDTCSIYLGNGTWNVPENVTVNAYESVYMAAPDSAVTIDGTWNVMNGNGGFSGQFGTVTVNGTVSLAQDVRGSVASRQTLVLNGTLNNAGTFYVYGEMVLADGAQVVSIPKPGIVNSVREVYLTSSGSITGPAEGRASVGGKITVTVDSALRGNLTVEELLIHDDVTLTVDEGADVTVTEITSNPYESGTTNLVVNGSLKLTTDGYNQVYNTVITLGENGVFRLTPYVQLGGDSSNSSFTGTGTLELEGEMMERDDGFVYCGMVPKVFGQNANKTDGSGLYLPLPGVGEGVNVVRLWDPDGSEGEGSGGEDSGETGGDSGETGDGSSGGSENDAKDAYADYINGWLIQEMEMGSPICESPELADELVQKAAAGEYEELEAMLAELCTVGIVSTVPMTFDEFTEASGGGDSGTIGDVTGDGNVQPDDLILLMKHLVGAEGAEIADGSGDLNGDSQVDILDVIALVKLLAE